MPVDRAHRSLFYVGFRDLGIAKITDLFLFCNMKINTIAHFSIISLKMMNKHVDGLLFPILESEINEVSERYRAEYEQSKLRVNNLHLLAFPSFAVEGKEEMPVVPAYTDPVPTDFIAYTQRRSKLGNTAIGIHCYEYDNRIISTWTNPLKPIESLKKYPCVIAPDFSLLVDQPRAINVTNVYRNRWVSCFWTSKGIKVIPSASWGSVDSFDYCFDGLPENSVISIGHVVEGKEKTYNQLYRLGVEELVRRKQPTKLVVYGAPLSFDPGVEVVQVNGVIQKLRQL